MLGAIRLLAPLRRRQEGRARREHRAQCERLVRSPKAQAIDDELAEARVERQLGEKLPQGREPLRT